MGQIIRDWVVPLMVGFICGDFLRLVHRYLRARIDEIEKHNGAR